MHRVKNSNKLSRGQFLKSGLILGLTLISQPFRTWGRPKQTFFTLKQIGKRWWLITPSGKPFFSMGMNHIDPASLRYPENIHIWRKKYGGSMDRWLKESVAPRLKDWGFNSIGWVQEVSVRQWQHSRSFTYAEYQAVDMPYCHMLPFTESHQWEQHVNHYDFHSKEWEEWCDYVARAHCAELAEDPHLIGYFYSDCPTWVHTRPANTWRGPIFDPEKLKTETGRRELRALTRRYYQTTYEAIRRYDRNHLIFGDRYEANAPLPIEVVEEALPFVDVLSFQDFRDPLKHLDEWHKRTEKPVLLADAAKMKWNTQPGEFSRNNGDWYGEILKGLFENPGCIGFHLCGAFHRNRARRYGLLDEQERPDIENIAKIQAANSEIQTRIDQLNAN